MSVHQVSATAAAEVAPWLERFARVGFAVKGVLYLTIGVLSARAAVGAGGRAVTDTHEAMDALGGAFGRPLLAVIALGLAGYGLWQIIAAITDAERSGRAPTGIAKRVAAAARGLAHLALAGTALSLAIWRSATGSHDAHARHWTARLLDAPGGVFVVCAIAISVGAYGIYQLYCAWTAKLDQHLDLSRLAAGRRRLVIAISRFGIAARAIVFISFALLFARAAITRNPNAAGGPGASLRELFAFGRPAFIVITIGLAAYGLYQLLNARYRRIAVR